MGDKKKQKFSLSDIIRKLNEAPGTDTNPVEGEPLSTQPSPLPTSRADAGAAAFPVYKPENRDAEPGLSSSNGGPATPVSAAAAPALVPPAPRQSDTIDALAPALESAGGDEGGDFDIMRYVGILLRRKSVIVAAIIIASMVSAFSYLNAVRLYTAHARMLFSPGYQDIMGNNLSMYFGWGSREEKLNTHLELLKSQTVLQRVSENLNKSIGPGGIGGGLRITRGGVEGEKTDIIDISFSHTGAETARDVVNMLCKTYIEYMKEVNVQDITRLILKLEDQIVKVEKDLDVKENSLRIFKESNRTVQLSTETNVTIAKLSQVETARQQTQLDMLESKEKFLGLKNEINQQQVDVIQSITYQNPYQSRLAELELQLNTLSAEYSGEHYKVKMVKAEIDKIKEAMKSDIIKEAASKTFVKNPIRQSLLQELINVTIEKSVFDAKRNAQEQIAKQLDAELQKLPSVELQYAQLTRETESLLQVLKLLKTRYEEAKIKRDSQDSDLKILEWAQTPTIAVSNVKSSKISITIFIGLIIGIVLAFLLEYLDQSIKEPQDIERILGLPLLGLVPMIETEKAIIESSKDRGKTVLEPFRTLRANVKYIAESRNAKTFIVSSAVKGEGKTTLAANIAITFAMDGKKAILVDGDLRRAQMHGLFHLPKKNGLCDYLLGACEVQDILKPTVHQNLFVITSGEHPQNPAELVGSYRFGLLVKELRALADIVVFDSPALLPVSDALSMAPKMDACIIVVRSLWTPLKAAQQAKIQLRRIGCTIIGAILNGISHSRGYYPYYYGYYRYYAYKYSYEEDDKSKFSMRRFGLAAESKFKETAQTIRLSFPQWILGFRYFLRYLHGRKTFWILLSIAFALFAAGIVVERSGFFIRPKRTITYLGAPSDRTKEPLSVAPSFLLNQAKPMEAVTGNAAQFLAIKNLLKDWQEAFNKKDADHYVTYYDSLHFHYPGGTYATWKAELIKNMLGPLRNSTLHIDSLWLEALDAYIKTSMDISMISGIDTVLQRFEMIFQQSNNQWRIIREKQRAR